LSLESGCSSQEKDVANGLKDVAPEREIPSGNKDIFVKDSEYPEGNRDIPKFYGYSVFYVNELL
jgi:hypothetical protein